MSNIILLYIRACLLISGIGNVAILNSYEHGKALSDKFARYRFHFHDDAFTVFMTTVLKHLMTAASAVSLKWEFNVILNPLHADFHFKRSTSLHIFLWKLAIFIL
jgi:hypothetical protein